jgi:hypothetical protein
MPRYVVERTFPSGLDIPIKADGEAAYLSVAPTPEAARNAGGNSLPVDQISRVRVLDPYFYR